MKKIIFAILFVVYSGVTTVNVYAESTCSKCRVTEKSIEDEIPNYLIITNTLTDVYGGHAHGGGGTVVSVTIFPDSKSCNEAGKFVEKQAGRTVVGSIFDQKHVVKATCRPAKTN